MKWRIVGAARAELEEAAEWYESAREGLGAEFMDAFEAGVGQITALPHAWQPLGHAIRRYRLKRFPYGIIYRVDADNIVVLAVAHLHRRPGYWRNRATGQ